ncbi:MAG: flagellar biosynthetic protein FliO [Myxococcota bacterium]|jgi:flagellar biogenesis protein FliO|nr:flagellar biosynthetic protein FliO [Myxococcota bacterium]
MSALLRTSLFLCLVPLLLSVPELLVAQQDESTAIEGKLASGQSLLVALRSKGLRIEQTRAPVDAIATIYDFRGARTGDRFQAELNENGSIKVLRFFKSENAIFVATRNSDGTYAAAKVTQAELDTSRESVEEAESVVDRPDPPVDLEPEGPAPEGEEPVEEAHVYESLGVDAELPPRLPHPMGQNRVSRIDAPAAMQEPEPIQELERGTNTSSEWRLAEVLAVSFALGLLALLGWILLDQLRLRRGLLKGNMKLLETMRLGPQQRLLLVEAGQRQLLLSQQARQLTLLAVLKNGRLLRHRARQRPKAAPSPTIKGLVDELETRNGVPLAQLEREEQNHWRSRIEQEALRLRAAGVRNVALSSEPRPRYDADQD